MKLVLIFILIFLSYDGSAQKGNNAVSINKKDELVYLCTGYWASAYHKNSKCDGILSCKQTIVKINKTEALKKGRKSCKMCYSK